MSVPLNDYLYLQSSVRGAYRRTPGWRGCGAGWASGCGSTGPHTGRRSGSWLPTPRRCRTGLRGGTPPWSVSTGSRWGPLHHSEFLFPDLNIFRSVADPLHLIRIRILGSVPLTNRPGCGSGRPKTVRIRIHNTDFWLANNIKDLLVLNFYCRFLSTAFLVEVSGHKLKSSHIRVFVWFSTIIFPFYKMLFMNRLEFSCCADFF